MEIEVKVRFIITVPDNTNLDTFYFGDCIDYDIVTKDGFEIEDYSTGYVEKLEE